MENDSMKKKIGDLITWNYYTTSVAKERVDSHILSGLWIIKDNNKTGYITSLSTTNSFPAITLTLVHALTSR